jgi:hypothetical protein
MQPMATSYSSQNHINSRMRTTKLSLE